MVEPSQDKLYATTLQTIGAVAMLPVVRVDREAFLRKHDGHLRRSRDTVWTAGCGHGDHRTVGSLSEPVRPLAAEA